MARAVIRRRAPTLSLRTSALVLLLGRALEAGAAADPSDWGADRALVGGPSCQELVRLAHDLYYQEHYAVYARELWRLWSRRSGLGCGVLSGRLRAVARAPARAAELLGDPEPIDDDTLADVGVGVTELPPGLFRWFQLTQRALRRAGRLSRWHLIALQYLAFAQYLVWRDGWRVRDGHRVAPPRALGVGLRLRPPR